MGFSNIRIRTELLLLSGHKILMALLLRLLETGSHLHSSGQTKLYALATDSVNNSTAHSFIKNCNILIEIKASSKLFGMNSTAFERFRSTK